MADFSRTPPATWRRRADDGVDGSIARVGAATMGRAESVVRFRTTIRTELDARARRRPV